MITEDLVEQQALAWLEANGWAVETGSNLSPETAPEHRADWASVVLSRRLADAIRELNPQVPEATVEEVVRLLTDRPHADLFQANGIRHQQLVKGVAVEYANDHDEKVVDQVQLVDFGDTDANDWLVVSQLQIKGSKTIRKPDLLLFLNGLPVANIELKNPADKAADVWKAYHQIQTYKAEMPDLYVPNIALVVSDGTTACIGSLTANKERFMPWRAITGEDDRPTLEYELEAVIRGFFDRTLFLDYLRSFVLFEEDDGQVIKKIAGYHQFHGVRAAVARTLEVKGNSGKAGVFWHTQGSGKSISMAFYAAKLLREPAMGNPTVVVVTDRVDLDGQLFSQFAAAKELLGEEPEQAATREELRQKLTARQSGGVIFTTIQRFAVEGNETKHPLLCDRTNVVVMTDEAHRSQYGLSAKLDQKTGKYKIGYAKNLRDALPNASFIGFTGTPISSEDKDTRAVFGEDVSVYDIQDAVADGATVPIYYELRRAKLDINHDDIDRLSEDVEDVLEGEEDVAAREKDKSNWSQLAKIVGSEPRLKQVAADLIEHYERRAQLEPGKAMIVTMSREICVALFDEIVALQPDWAGTLKGDGYDVEDGAIRIVMTSTATDKEALQRHAYSPRQKKRLEKRFKDPDDPLKLVIVRDMWLTGFDAPCCNTMYVDKPMHGHGLMQAIARVNRVFGDKPGGLVVDYIGIGAELKKALKQYVDAKGKGQPTIDAHDALRIVREKLDTLRGILHEFDWSEYESRPLELLAPTADHVLSREDGKKRFLDAVVSLSKAFALCSTLDEAAVLDKEIAFLKAVAAVLAKAGGSVAQRSRDDKHAALKQILDNALTSDGVEDIFALAGVEKPNIGLLDDEFLDEVRQMPTRNLAVELLERLLKDEIKSRSKRNVVQEKKYGERLEETLRKYNNRSIEAGQVIEELIAMAEDIRAAAKRDESLNLSADELAFYDALAERPDVLREMGDETLQKLARELTEKLRNSRKVDWSVRESVRAEMRLLVKRLLRKYKYPPEGQERATELVLEQAERLAGVWDDEA